MKRNGYSLVGDLVLWNIVVTFGGRLFSYSVARLGDGLLRSVIVATIGVVIVVLIVRLLI